MPKNKKKTVFLNLVSRRLWLVIFLLFVLLRLPSLFEPFTYGDEGIYLALGQAKRAGLTLYRDIHDNKPPLLYLIAALAPNFFSYRLIYFLFSLVGFLVFRLLTKALYPKSAPSQAVCLVAFAILASIPLFEGQIANAENYLIYSSIVGFLILVKAKSALSYLAAGTFFSISTLFKIPGGFDFIAAGLVFFLLIPEKIKTILSFWQHKRFWFFLLGFALPISLTTLYYYQAGAGPAFVKAAFAQNIPYLSSWNQQKTNGSQLPVSMIGRSLIVLLPTLILFALRQKKRVNQTVKISLVWFVCAIFAAILSSRPYPHYLLQAMPAFCLAAGLIISDLKILRSLPIILALCLALVFEKYHYYGYPNFAYYHNFWQRVTGRISQQQYLDFWGIWAHDLPQIGEYLRAHSQPDQKIFIWSDQPAIYPLSQRLTAGRFTAAYHVKTFDPNYQETLSALRQETPIFFLVDKTEQETLGPLRFWLEQHYVRTVTIGEIIFYRYLPPVSII